MPRGWTKVALEQSRPVRLGVVVAIAAALALVDALTTHCLTVDAAGRGNKRREAGVAMLKQAVGAIVGNVLMEWRRDPPCAVHQSHTRAAFTGELVGCASYVAAERALLSLHLLERKAGVAYPLNDSPFGGYQLHAARLRPTAALLALAIKHGLSPVNVKDAFKTDYPAVPVIVRRNDLIVVKEFRSPRKKVAGLSTRRLPHVESAAVFDSIREDVAAMNAEAARHEYEGCRPPSWSRVFTESPLLHGRWYAKGVAYLTATKPERAAIRIDGAPVVELDIRASHMTILAALAGFTMPEGDPYSVPGVPRGVVKQWVVETLAKGHTPSRWSERTRSELPDIAMWRIGDVRAATLQRLPLLEKPAAPGILTAAGLDGLEMDASPDRLLSLRLVAIEAEAMTLAMRQLREAGAVALSVHDSLIVPVDAEAAAREAMREACRVTYGVVPTITGGGAQ